MLCALQPFAGFFFSTLASIRRCLLNGSHSYGCTIRSLTDFLPVIVLKTWKQHDSDTDTMDKLREAKNFIGRKSGERKERRSGGKVSEADEGSRTERGKQSDKGAPEELHRSRAGGFKNELMAALPEDCQRAVQAQIEILTNKYLPPSSSVASLILEEFTGKYKSFARAIFEQRFV